MVLPEEEGLVTPHLGMTTPGTGGFNFGFKPAAQGTPASGGTFSTGGVGAGSAQQTGGTPAPATGGFSFSGFGLAGAGQQSSQQAGFTAAPAPAPFGFTGQTPAPAPGATGQQQQQQTATGGVSFGGPVGTGFGVGFKAPSTTQGTAPASTFAQAPTPAPAPGGFGFFGAPSAGTSTITGAAQGGQAVAAPAPGAQPSSLFGGGAAGTTAQTGTGASGLFGGGGVGGAPGAAGGAAQQALRGGLFGQKAAKPAQALPEVDLRALYRDILDEPVFFSDEESSEQLDRILDKDERAVEALLGVLGNPDHRARFSTVFAVDPAKRYYRPPSQESAAAFEAFEKGQRKLTLLPGWKEVGPNELPGGAEERAGVKALARFLQVEESKALHILHLFQKDRYRRGLDVALDRREYSSLVFYERVRRYYHNQRIYLLKMLQEFFRIDQDVTYPESRLRDAVSDLIEEMDKPTGALGTMLTTAVESLCLAPAPSVQELNPVPYVRHRSSSEWWERQRSEWVMQSLIEEREVLLLLLLGGLAKRITPGFDTWNDTVKRWAALRLGELAPDKHYLVASEPEAAVAVESVGSLMVLVAIQAMQLGELMPGRDAAPHPFFADLVKATSPPDVLDILRDDRVTTSTLPLSVVGLLWACFVQLSRSELLERLKPEVKEYWRNPQHLVQIVGSRTPDTHLALLVRRLLVEPVLSPAAADREPNLGTKWAMVGFQMVLRQNAEHFRPDSLRPELNAIRLPLAEAFDALVAACFLWGGDQEYPHPPLMNNAMTQTRLEYHAMVAAAIYHGSELLNCVFWDTVLDQGAMESPPMYFLVDACLNSPLILFHLVSAMASDPVSAMNVAQFFKRPFVSGYDDQHLDVVGEDKETQMPLVVARGNFFDRRAGVEMLRGAVGLVRQSPGLLPRVEWRVSLWSVLLRQLEGFISIVHRFGIRNIVETLQSLKDRLESPHALEGGGGEYPGWNTLIDRAPHLFIYGPCAPETDAFLEELTRRGASNIMRFCMRSAEMVMDQLAILLTMNPRDVPEVISEALGPEAAIFQRKLPQKLLQIVRAAARDMSQQTSGLKAEAFVSLQASALNLLSRFCASDPGLPWRTETVRALVREHEEDGPLAYPTKRVAFINWLGERSLEADQSLNQYRVARDVLRLMQYLVEQACDDSWEGKSAILPLNVSDTFIASLVDFAAKVLLTLETWTFTRALDRWMLALSCLGVINAFTSRSFVLTDPSTRGLELHRRSLLRRFRQDSVLLSGLLRCIEYMPSTALAAMLENRARRRPAYRYLDELCPESTNPEQVEAGEGLFLASEGVLPLGFEHGLAATASREERGVLEDLAIHGLKTVELVVKQFLQDTQEGSVPLNGAFEASALDASGDADGDINVAQDPSLLYPGALDLLTKPADLPGSSLPQHWAAGQRPLVTHMALLTSLALFSERNPRPSDSVSVAALETMRMLARYVAALRRMRQRQQELVLPDWPSHLPYPFPPGVLESLLSVSDARGLRRGMFRCLGDVKISSDTVVVTLDYLVDVIKLRPSLARHLVYFRRTPEAEVEQQRKRKGGNEDADERAPGLEAVVATIMRRSGQLLQQALHEGAKYYPGGRRVPVPQPKKNDDQAKREEIKRLTEVSRRDAELRRRPELLLASTARFLCAVLRHATRQRRMELLADMEQDVWDVLVEAVESLVLDESSVSTGPSLVSYCYQLTVHRFALEAFALLAAVVGSEADDGRSQVVKKAMENSRAAMQKLAGVILPRGANIMGDPSLDPHAKQLKIYMTESYSPTEVAVLETKAGGGRGSSVPVSAFRMQDWEDQISDPSPRRFGAQEFVYDLEGFVRYVHTSSALVQGSETEEDAVKIKRLAVLGMRMLNQSYSKASAQHTLNKAFNSMAQVLMAKMKRSDALTSRGIDVERTAELVFDLLLQDLGQAPITPAMAITTTAPGLGFPGRNTLDDASGAHINNEAMRRRTDRVEVSRRMRKPKIELLARISATYRDRLNEEKATRALEAIERCFEQLAVESVGPGPWGSEMLQLDLRQGLLSATLLLLGSKPLVAKTSRDGPLPYVGGILTYSIQSLTTLESVLVHGSDVPAIRDCRSDRVETIVQTILLILTNVVTQAAPSSASGAEEDDDVRRHEQDEVDEAIVRELMKGRLLETALSHWISASRVAAASFPAIHDYTLADAGKPGVAALSDKAVRLSLARLETLLTFFCTGASVSHRFSQYLVDAHFVAVLIEDPTIVAMANAVSPKAGVPIDLLYQHGYRADGAESPYHKLWIRCIQLLATTLHRLTSPSLGYEAVLALPFRDRDESMSYGGPHRPEEAAVMQQIGGFLRMYAPLLLWPLAENRVLTLALLREADAVMVLVRELAVHGYMAEPGQTKGLKDPIKDLVKRSAVLLAQTQAEEGGALITLLGDSFAAVTPHEQKLLKQWEERRAATTDPSPPPPKHDIECMLEDGLIRILSSAAAFLRYTGPARLPTHIPLSKYEARQISLQEGTKVWFRDVTGFSELEGVIHRRFTEYVVGHEMRLGKYDIRLGDGRLEVGVHPERITGMEDRDAQELLTTDLEFDLADNGLVLGGGAQGKGRLAVGHLLAIARFGVRKLEELSQESPQATRAADRERQEHCCSLLRHTLFLLLHASCIFLRREGIKEGERQRFIHQLVGVLGAVGRWNNPLRTSADIAEGAYDAEARHEQAMRDVKGKRAALVEAMKQRKSVSDRDVQALLAKCSQVQAVKLAKALYQDMKSHRYDVSLPVYVELLLVLCGPETDPSADVQSVREVICEMSQEGLHRLLEDIKP